ncbi:MAG: ATP-binding cassette domain-containing protein [Bacilli bacterium]|nr:ATP-binding cassette domain-containing protein [Bacilli bacterium]
MEIKVSNIYYSIDDKDLFSNLSIEFKDNEITGVIGPVGSGKSILLELIGNLRDVNDGQIDIGSICLNAKPKKKDLHKHHKEVGILFQSPYDQIYNLTVKKELFLCLSDLKLSKDEINERISSTLKLVELDESYMSKNPFDLSQSELKKVALASVLIRKPKLLLLDEPTAGFDASGIKMLINMLKLLRKKESITAIIVSSDVDFINQIADEIVVLKQGKVIKKGKRLDVFKDEKFLKDNGVNVPKIIEFENYVLNEKGIKIGYREEINDLLKDIFRYAK